jgi:hypothetical protein
LKLREASQVVVLLFSDSAERFSKHRLYGLKSVWSKVNKTAENGRTAPLFYCFGSSIISSIIFLTTISNRTTMEITEVNALGWVKA